MSRLILSISKIIKKTIAPLMFKGVNVKVYYQEIKSPDQREKNSKYSSSRLLLRSSNSDNPMVFSSRIWRCPQKLSFPHILSGLR